MAGEEVVEVRGDESAKGRGHFYALEHFCALKRAKKI